MSTKAKLGFIGNGNMGWAITSGLIETGSLKAEEIAVFDLSEPNRQRAQENGCIVCKDELELIESSEAILIAVKPQSVPSLFPKIGQAVTGKLVLSIVAGYSEAALREALGNENERILRIMPNTPAMVGAGVFALDQGTGATEEEKQQVASWLSKIGVVEWIPENLFPVITALSGGGPAFVALFIEALADGGVRGGLRRDMALKIAAQTVMGSAKQVLDMDLHPAVLKDMVCSPAGTTIEGVIALEDGNFRASVIDSVTRAADRAANLK